MYKYFNRLNTDDGKALPGYQVRLMTTEPEVAVDIFADESGTPIESVSGIPNAALTDNGGNYQFFVEPGTYNIVFSSPGGTFLDRIRAVPMLNGPKGDKGDTGGPRALTTLADLKAALTGDDTFIYDSAPFKWTLADFTGQADDIIVVKSDFFPLSTGAWVRQGADKVAAKLDDAQAVIRTQQDKNSDFINVLDFVQPDDPDLTNALERLIYFAFPGTNALRIFVPQGVWTVTRQIIPRRQVIIKGAGESSTVLKFVGVSGINATMKGAFSFGQLATLNAYTTNPDGKITANSSDFTDGAASSQISDLQIQVDAGSSLDAIWSAALITCERVFSFRGAFRFLSGTLQFGSGVIVGNTNHSRIDHCTVLFANQDAFVFDGSDVNNLTIQNNNCFQPTRHGYVDGSFLGLNMPGCTTDGGVDGFHSVNPTGAQRSLYVGAYSEPNGSGEPWNVQSGTLILQPQGASPVGQPGGKNTTWAATPVAGLWGNQDINVTYREQDAFGIGDATHRAARYGRSGMLVRDETGGLAGFVSGGDGSYITYNGANVMKIARGAAIATPNYSAADPTKAEFDALVDTVRSVLTRMRDGLPTIST